MNAASKRMKTTTNNVEVDLAYAGQRNETNNNNNNNNNSNNLRDGADARQPGRGEKERGSEEVGDDQPRNPPPSDAQLLLKWDPDGVSVRSVLL